MLICPNLHTMMNSNFRDILRAHLLDGNDNYIGIGINITKNKRCCSVILITICWMTTQ